MSEAAGEVARIPYDGACDTHMHFYGPYDRYPLASTSPNSPPEALIPAYRKVQERLGLERVVVVHVHSITHHTVPDDGVAPVAYEPHVPLQSGIRPQVRREQDASLRIQRTLLPVGEVRAPELCHLDEGSAGGG